MNYTRTAVKGITYGVIFNILAGITAYLTRLILARSMTPAEYGLFYAVFTLVTFSLFFRDLGFDQALVKYIAEWKVTKKYNEIKTAIAAVLCIQLVASIILSIVFFTLADFLAQNYFRNPAAATILKVLIIYVLFSLTIRTIRGLFQGIQEMGLFSSTEFIKNTIVFITSAIFISLGFGIFAPMIAFAIVGPIFLLTYLPFIIKKYSFLKDSKIANFSSTAHQLWIFGMQVFATSAGSKIIGEIDTLILTYTRTLTEVGIYNVVLPSAMALLMIGTSAASAAFPMVSELWAKNDKIRLSKGITLLNNYSFVIMAPVLLTIAVFASFFLNLLFGSEYTPGSTALQILLIGVLFFIVAVINMNIISGIGKPKEVTKIVIAAAVVNLILNIIFIPIYGINGAAFATTISYLLALLISTRKVTTYMNIQFPIKQWLKTALAAAIFVAILISIAMLNINPWLEMPLAVITAAIAYIIITYALKLVNIAEIKHYIKLAHE
jgi:stage V sporulation protein B